MTDIPSRLAALTPADVDALSANPAPTSAERFVTVALARQRRRHRTQRVWPAIAVAATIVAAIAIVRRPGNETEPAALALAALDGGAAVAAAAPIAKPWGTEVRLTARQLTASNGYRMWVVDRSGHREVAATWAATAANAYRVTGATGITSRDLARIEITTTTDDTPLLAYES